jgi:mycothiol synthase
MEIRSLTAQDVPAVAGLCEQELRLDRAAATLPALLMRRSHVALVAAAAAGGVIGACFGSVADSPAPSQDGCIDLIVVAAGEWRRGVGRRLVGEMERQLAGRGCQRVLLTGNGLYYAWPGVDIHYTAAICLADDLGYQRTGCEVNMDVDLGLAPLDTRADEERLRGLGILVRTASQDDAALLRRSLSSTWQPGWIGELVAALHTDGAGLQLALRGQECVGFCAFGLRRRHEVGPIGASPVVRRRGIGGVLLKRCLSQQRELGLDAAELVWAGPLSYFSTTVHATIGRAFWTYAKDLAYPEPPPSWRDRTGLIEPGVPQPGG